MMLYEQVEEREGRGVVTAIGTCKFCGQTATCGVLEGWGQEKIDELATETCSCPDAKSYSFKKGMEGRAYGKIEMLFGKENKTDAIHSEVTDLLHEATYLICKGFIQSITVDIGMGVKGKISMTQKDTIKVMRTRTDTSTYET